MSGNPNNDVEDVGGAVEGNQSANIYNAKQEVVAEIIPPPRLIPIGVPHPEEWHSKARFRDDEDEPIAHDDLINPGINVMQKQYDMFELESKDMNVPHQLPTAGYMMAMRGASLNAQQDDGTWNPVQEGRPPPWLEDGFKPAWTQWEFDKKAAESAAASIDPSTLASLVAGRNLAYTHLHQDRDEAEGKRPKQLDKELYQLPSAYEPLYYQELLQNYDRYSPALLQARSDVGSEYTLDAPGPRILHPLETRAAPIPNEFIGETN